MLFVYVTVGFIKHYYIIKHKQIKYCYRPANIMRDVSVSGKNSKFSEKCIIMAGNALHSKILFLFFLCLYLALCYALYNAFYIMYIVMLSAI